MRTGYLYDNDSPDSADQHRCLSEAYDPMTIERLAGTGVTNGWDCLDVGAGAGSIALWLARSVTPGGSVLATDVRPSRIPAASGLLAVQHDIVHDPLPDNAFDLIHARLVLCWLPQRHTVLARLVRALKPGGLLQLDELDTSHAPPLLTPDARARDLYETYLETKAAVWAASGADGAWASRVPQAMHDTGLIDIDVVSHVEPWHAQSPGLRLQISHTLRARDRFVAAGMTDQQLADVREVMAHSSFRALSTVFYSVQGRRPAQGGG